MIRIDLGPEVDSPTPSAGRRHGIFEYRITSLGIVGYSRQPLLDACRQIKRILGDTAETAALFREGRSVPDISCSVAEGAEITVSEPNNGKIRFAKFREFQSVFRTSEPVTMEESRP
jgi:hypothetical protein